MIEKLVNSLLFKPPRNSYRFPAAVTWLVTSKNNRIAACFIKRKGAVLTVLYSHGNAEDLSTSYNSMRRLSRDLNVSVMGYDYSGYGECTGVPSEENCYADIDAVYRYLTEDEGIKSEHIVLLGRSLGSGPSCYLAAKSAREGRSVAAMILYSPFTSVYRVVLDFGFSISGDKFKNIDRVPNLQCPVFIVHGREDEVVPFEHGEALYEALPDDCKTAPFWVEGMGHNNPGRQGELAIVARIAQFLEYHVLLRKGWLLPSTRTTLKTPGVKVENGKTKQRPAASVRASM